MSPWVWLPLALLGCFVPPDSPVHAEALIGAGQLPAAALPALLARQPLSVDGPGHDGRFRVIASHQALRDLRALGLEVEIARPDHRRSAGRSPDYHDEDQMADALRDLAVAHPDSAELVDLGRSIDGRPLLALRIGDGDWRVRILATHHGDELSAAELALAVAQRLLEQSVDAEVWVVPHVNPDGVADGTRYNARSVDLNRNYGYKWSESEYRAGEAPFSEPESRAVRTLSSYRSFGSGLSMHAGAALICYVWNYTTQDSQDEALLIEQADAYWDLCDVSGFYRINGGAWYITHGDTTDWSYGRQGTLDYTLEVSVDKTPPASQLHGLIDDHMDAVLDFVQREPAIQGIVRDAEDGAPIEAIISLEGAGAGVSGPDGRFSRWADAGTVSLEVQAPGFVERWVEIELQQGVSQVLELELQRGELLALRPVPALLTWGDGERELVLPGVEDEQVTLSRVGYPSLTIARSGDGYGVVPSELEPGAWSIETSQGSAPRALFIGERDDRVQLHELSWQGDEILVQGQGFEDGTRAWAITGEARSLIPLELVQATDQSLVLDSQPIRSELGVIDLLVVSSGAQLAALDLASGAVVDTGTPADSRPPGPDSDPPLRDSRPPTVGGGRCGCAASSSPGLAPALFLVTLASVFGLRRRERNSYRVRVSVESGLFPDRSDHPEALLE